MEKVLTPKGFIIQNHFNDSPATPWTMCKRYLRDATIVKHPKRVLLHVGTNDIDICDEVELISKFKDTILNIRSKMPNTKIYVSQIFTRRRPDDPINKLTCIVNEEISLFCEEKIRVATFSNSNITCNQFYDNKHIDTGGLYIFLCNIRFALFGKMPAGKSRSSGQPYRRRS